MAYEEYRVHESKDKKEWMIHEQRVQKKTQHNDFQPPNNYPKFVKGFKRRTCSRFSGNKLLFFFVSFPELFL